MDRCTACRLTGKGRSKGVLIQSGGHAACKMLVVLPLPDRGGVCGAASATMTRPWMLMRRTSPTGSALKVSRSRGVHVLLKHKAWLGC